MPYPAAGLIGNQKPTPATALVSCAPSVCTADNTDTASTPANIAERRLTDRLILFMLFTVLCGQCALLSILIYATIWIDRLYNLIRMHGV